MRSSLFSAIVFVEIPAKITRAFTTGHEAKWPLGCSRLRSTQCAAAAFLQSQRRLRLPIKERGILDVWHHEITKAAELDQISSAPKAHRKTRGGSTPSKASSAALALATSPNAAPDPQDATSRAEEAVKAYEGLREIAEFYESAGVDVHDLHDEFESLGMM